MNHDLYYTEAEAQALARNRAMRCPRCRGYVTRRHDVGVLGKPQGRLDLHCDDCGVRLEIAEP